MRLDIGIARSKDFLCPIAGEVLRNVHKFTSPVITLSRVAFGILVRQYGTKGFQDSEADEVLGCDQLELGMLSIDLVLNSIEDFDVGRTEGLSWVVLAIQDGVVSVSRSG